LAMGCGGLVVHRRQRCCVSHHNAPSRIMPKQQMDSSASLT
jgi:hypothetical protein